MASFTNTYSTTPIPSRTVRNQSSTVTNMRCIRCSFQRLALTTRATASTLSKPTTSLLRSSYVLDSLHFCQKAKPYRQIQSRTLTSLTSPLLRRPQLPRTNLESPTTSILAQTSFPSASPQSNGSALAGLGTATQVRGAKRDTYDPSHLVRKRRHGFLSRVKTRLGRKLLKRRKLKGRTTLSH